MKKFIFICFFCFLCSKIAFAQGYEKARYFDVDLDAPVPDLKLLKKKLTSSSEIYNPRYIASFKLGAAFDRVWRDVMTVYGAKEERLKAAGEDDLFDMIVSLPKEIYPYIGPFLHQSPGISERILNLPGIKETKNTFPQRIAPQLQGIEDLEFISPFLYILLMPEMWPQDKPMEQPLRRKAKLPPNKYRPDYFANLLDRVPQNGFGYALKNGQEPIEDKIRTLKVTKSSPLTSADVRAFARTLDGVYAFQTLDNNSLLIGAEHLIHFSELKKGTALEMNTLKDMVNPCQRAALKIKWAGLETEFLKSIASQGFSLKEWALTCDKTVKAYRATLVSDSKIAALTQFKKGLYDSIYKSMKQNARDKQIEVIYAMFEMYHTNENDVKTVLKNQTLLKEKFYPFGSVFLMSPLSF